MTGPYEDRVIGRDERWWLLSAPPGVTLAGGYRILDAQRILVGAGSYGVIAPAYGPGRIPLVAKTPTIRAGFGSTEVWMEVSPGQSRPVQVPGRVLSAKAGGAEEFVEVGPEQIRTVLHNEADLLHRDGGQLFPASYGLWEHLESGGIVLLMERLEGRRPESAEDIAAVLEALAEAAERGVFVSHGDLKPEHVFIDGGRVRLCDPAPDFADPALRGLTRTYNPHAYRGVAADVAGCATMLRYLPGNLDGHIGWHWTEQVLRGPEAPEWARDYRAALTMLRADLAGPVVPPDSWEVPPMERPPAWWEAWREDRHEQ